MTIPGYWMYETAGALRSAVEAYLTGRPMSEHDVAAMRAYLRQWMAAPPWAGVTELRDRVEGLTTKAAIEAWLDDAIELGIDPL